MRCLGAVALPEQPSEHLARIGLDGSGVVGVRHDSVFMYAQL